MFRIMCGILPALGPMDLPLHGVACDGAALLTRSV
jgi:hypothetical protein